jgi:hypothetical protein
LLKKFFDIYNYGSLGVVVVILILILTKAIPVGWFKPLVWFAVVLFLIRMTLRFYFIYKNKQENKRSESSNPPST